MTNFRKPGNRTSLRKPGNRMVVAYGDMSAHRRILEASGADYLMVGRVIAVGDAYGDRDNTVAALGVANRRNGGVS